MTKAFRWLWLGQLVSNLGTQCSLYGLGLWSFARQGQLLDFAAVAFVVQLSKLLVLPLLGRLLGQVDLIVCWWGGLRQLRDGHHQRKAPLERA